MIIVRKFESGVKYLHKSLLKLSVFEFNLL
jgi:hypothetical protein